MSNSIDTLKQSETNVTDFVNFTDEQTDAVIVYLAKIARETKTEYGMTEEQKQEHLKKFFAIMDSWPKEFAQRVRYRIIDSGVAKNAFWIVPADAMIAATRDVELA